MTFTVRILMVRNQFGVLDVELHSTHEAVLTPNTLRHLHKNPIAREHFTVTCTVTWLEKQVIAGLWDVPVLKTQTCNWNHSNSFHELFWRHTTHFAQPSYPRRSFFPSPPSQLTAAFALLHLERVKIHQFNKTYVPYKFSPRGKRDNRLGDVCGWKDPIIHVEV